MAIGRVDLVHVMLVTRRQNVATLTIAYGVDFALICLHVREVYLQVCLGLRVLDRFSVSSWRV